MTTVYVVTGEWNTESVNGEMFMVLGVYAKEQDAQDRREAECQDEVDQGNAVYQYPTDDDNTEDWDVEIRVSRHDVEED